MHDLPRHSIINRLVTLIATIGVVSLTVGISTTWATLTITSSSITSDSSLNINSSIFTTNGTFQGPLRDVVSVKDYGADGTGVADSAAAFQSAHDALGSSGTLFIPCGTYKLTSQINTTKSVWWRGAGSNCVVINFVPT